MLVLAADTSTKIANVAVLDGSKALASLRRDYSRSQGSALVDIIKKTLDRINYDIKQIELFCVGLGPGSFTGLRTSVAAMRSLSIALKKPLIGLSSFDVIANNCVGTTRQICALCDAKQNKVYARFYKINRGQFSSQGDRCPTENCPLPTSDFLLDSLEIILSRIKEPTVITGDAIRSYGSKILELTNGKALLTPEDLWYPKADILARLALNKYKKGYRDDPFNLLPLYIYPKECQVKEYKVKPLNLTFSPKGRRKG